MTIKQLKEIIKDLPDNMQVFVSERLTEFRYGLVNSAYTKEINFMEDADDDESLAMELVLIIDEE
jgi:hypothetical protein